MILSLISGALGAHLVIVDGSKDKTEATGKLERWAYADWPRSTAAPRLVDSSTVEGLNPGFHILVFGQFEHAEDAKAWSAYPNAFGQTSYVREVAGGGTDQRLEVETSLTVTFADGERRLPLPAVEVRSCQTGAV
ncbi:MAG: hypothetical protein GY884_11510, partial [Proteobacteria bacterium]|nr:hypothetical protein [Pseudomonadota bacterium]